MNLFWIHASKQLLPCAIESHPTPGDSRGSSSPFHSISGVSSHVADGGSARIPLALAPLTPVSIPVWCSWWSICLSFSPSTILSVLFSNTTTRKRRSSISHDFSLSQVSAPYSTIGNTKTFTSFTFVSSITPLSFHIDVSPPIAAFPIAILLCTSFSHSPSLVISAPKKTNFVTTSISFPSTVTSPLSPASEIILETCVVDASGSYVTRALLRRERTMNLLCQLTIILSFDKR